MKESACALQPCAGQRSRYCSPHARTPHPRHPPLRHLREATRPGWCACRRRRIPDPQASAAHQHPLQTTCAKSHLNRSLRPRTDQARARLRNLAPSSSLQHCSSFTGRWWIVSTTCSFLPRRIAASPVPKVPPRSSSPPSSR